MNYLFLSLRLFISSSNINESLSGQSRHGCRCFPFITLNILCHSLLACRISAEKSVDNLMGIPFYVVLLFPCCFIIFSLYLIFVINMCLLCSSFSSLQSLSPVRIFATLLTAALQNSLFITNQQSLCKLMSIELVMSSNHLILSTPLLLLLSIFSSIRGFSNNLALCIRGPKYQSFSFNISPSNEYSGLISFRMNWLDLLPVQGTLKSRLQHHSSKASILQCSVFFIVQLSHPYMTTGKTKALIRRTIVGKVSSLLFNMLSRFVIAFLPGSKCVLIS